MLNERDILLAFWNDAVNAGITGIEVSGVTIPADIDSGWWYGGIVNSRPSWAFDLTGVRYALSHSGEQWTLARADGNAVFFTRDNASPYGAYIEVEDSGVGEVTISPLPTWYIQRLSGDAPQAVLRAHSVRKDDDAYPERFRMYHIAFDIYHTIPDIAYAIGTAVADYYAQYSGTTTSAPGYLFGAFGAQQVQCDNIGLLESIAVKHGMLYRDTVEVTLINVSALSDAS